jgi:pimeloyl-ACP methyl ester carboxylesterase
MRISSSPLAVAVFGMLGLLASARIAHAGEYAAVGKDLKLFYEQAGRGAPVVFIPGWTMSTEVFSQQLAYFGKRFRAIAYDPRSQGRSTKTPEDNDYSQRGKDLKAFLDVLGIQEVVLVGWSNGCYDAYSFARTFGTKRLRAFVCIDQVPQPPDPSGCAQRDQWFGEGWRRTAHDRREDVARLARWMVLHDLKQQELEWIEEQALRTPTYAALVTKVDARFSDFSPEARAMDGAIPVLHVIRQERSESVRAWLRQNTPKAEVAALGGHMMFWEQPAEFNAVLEDFLSRHLAPGSRGGSLEQ